MKAHGPVLWSSTNQQPSALCRSLSPWTRVSRWAYLPGLAMRRIADLHPGCGEDRRPRCSRYRERRPDHAA
jgi:hypothetical protein